MGSLTKLQLLHLEKEHILHRCRSSNLYNCYSLHPGATTVTIPASVGETGTVENPVRAKLK